MAGIRRALELFCLVGLFQSSSSLNGRHSSGADDDGPFYKLWLDFSPLNASSAQSYDHVFQRVLCHNASSISPLATACTELSESLSSLLGKHVPAVFVKRGADTEIALDEGDLDLRLTSSEKDAELALLRYPSNIRAEEEFYMSAVTCGASKCLRLEGASGRAVLFGSFRLLSQVQTGVLDPSLQKNFPRTFRPGSAMRLVNMWDNLDGSTEYAFNMNRSFAQGPRSIFHWDTLPKVARPRYVAFARFLSSVGVNGLALNNINSCSAVNSQILSSAFLQKASLLGKIFSSFGIATLLCPCFASPQMIGKLNTSDPLNAHVIDFWTSKSKEIKKSIPGFAGYVIKADSEGETGPAVYNRSIPEAANMLAAALVNSKAEGFCIWRSFMHPGQWDGNKTKGMDQPLFLFETFVKLDGQFSANVVLQTKTGPFDFQTHEPVQSIFGSMHNTQLIMEVEVAQTFTGQGKLACFLPSQWKHYLDFQVEEDMSLAELLTADECEYCGMAGVNNFFELELQQQPCSRSIGPGGTQAGEAEEAGDAALQAWTLSLLGSSNMYGFGRLAWAPHPRGAASIAAQEWANATLPWCSAVASSILLQSWPAFNNVTSPLGLGYIVDSRYHFFMDPHGWQGTGHPPNNGFGGGFNASKYRVGFNRSVSYGQTYSNKQFSHALRDPKSTPLELLLTFHNLPYDYPLSHGHAGNANTSIALLDAFYEAHTVGLGHYKGFAGAWRDACASAMMHTSSDTCNAALACQTVQEKLDQAIVIAANFSKTLHSYFDNITSSS